MKLTILKSKVHCAIVTKASLDYEGSIEIDETLMKAAGIIEYEKVLVANFTNGNRYETYVMKGMADSGVICVNGAGARYSAVGDKVTIFAFAQVEESERISPKIVLVDERNRIKSIRSLQ
ncbi:MAG: aspartate 1-decarboxylase [Candidatus Bathyarchaeota archaeon]|nr:MAG: aspartate 1-decarboxylase [Candidatus Bathyarchaeota archaeon]